MAVKPFDADCFECGDDFGMDGGAEIGVLWRSGGDLLDMNDLGVGFDFFANKGG